MSSSKTLPKHGIAHLPLPPNASVKCTRGCQALNDAIISPSVVLNRPTAFVAQWGSPHLAPWVEAP